MKEKISLLAKGIFEYEKPEIAVSTEKIELEIEAGKSCDGFFEISSAGGYEIRMKAFSSNKLMQLKSNDYCGEKIKVAYTFDAAKLEIGEEVTGHISIISNGGEIEVPFDVHVCQPFCYTSIGPVRDLAQFTNLAQSNWHEAVKLFYSDNFARVFLVNKNYAHIYAKLISSRNPNQAMEEFLCTIRRKRKIELKIAQDNIEFSGVNEMISERLVIEKNQWGYQKIFIETVGDFIQVYKKELSTEDFLGSYYELEYMIDPDFFRTGNNYGKIIVRTQFQTIEVLVSCLKDKTSRKIHPKRTIQECVFHMMDDYVNLCMGRMDKEKWIRLTRENVDCCQNNSKEAVYSLFEAHFSLIAGERENAAAILHGINGRELRHQSATSYCYYLYLSACSREEDAYTKFAAGKIGDYYEGRYSDWRLLWMKMALAGNRISLAKRYAMIKTQFERGCISPVLYWEAVTAINSQPSLLREFDDFEIQLVAWGTKKDCLDRDVIYQFADVAAKSRGFSPLALKVLMEQCRLFESKELLLGVCALLIRGNKVEHCYNHWYRLGIESSLKLKGLYENYMYSLDETADNKLPAAVLIYFYYDNQLSASKKACLYAYIIKNKALLQSIYRDYENIMKAFAYEQLSKGTISRDMVVLYENFIDSDKMTGKIAEKLPKVLFKYEVHVKNPWIQSVIVSHREVSGDCEYPVIGGYAYVDIYMEDYLLVFVDKLGGRYNGSVEYTLSPLLDVNRYIKACYALNHENPMILMNRSERAIKYQKSDDASIDIYKQTIRLNCVCDQYRKNILKNLIDYYYDNYEGETLEKYLLKLDISLLDSDERGNIIEYYIQRSLFDKAYEAIVTYGYENIQDKKLMRLCSKIIRDKGMIENKLLIEMAYYAFSCGKYDDVTLEYLIRFYLGTTKDLYEIWKAAKNFEVNAFELEEKILCQVLFAEMETDYDVEIFESYYKMTPDTRIVRAFLTYYSYQYLVREKDIPESVFKYIEIECDQMSGAADVCCLALLKFYAAGDGREAGHRQWILTKLTEFIDRGMIFPFFKKFIYIKEIPEEIVDKTYVSYRTNPKNIVTIHYMIEDGSTENGTYEEEEMKNVFGGIFIKVFTLFKDEKLKYYITEHNAFEQKVTQSRIIDGADSYDDKKTVQNGHDWINRMVALSEAGDMAEVKRELTGYEEKRFLTKKLFTLI